MPDKFAHIVEVHGDHESLEGLCRWGFAVHIEWDNALMPTIHNTYEEAEKWAKSRDYIVL